MNWSFVLTSHTNLLRISMEGRIKEGLESIHWRQDLLRGTSQNMFATMKREGLRSESAQFAKLVGR